jgi:hypothetical protein
VPFPPCFKETLVLDADHVRQKGAIVPTLYPGSLVCIPFNGGGLPPVGGRISPRPADGGPSF